MMKLVSLSILLFIFFHSEKKLHQIPTHHSPLTTHIPDTLLFPDENHLERAAINIWR